MTEHDDHQPQPTGDDALFGALRTHLRHAEAILDLLTTSPLLAPPGERLPPVQLQEGFIYELTFAQVACIDEAVHACLVLLFAEVDLPLSTPGPLAILCINLCAIASYTRRVRTSLEEGEPDGITAFSCLPLTVRTQQVHRELADLVQVAGTLVLHLSSLVAQAQDEVRQRHAQRRVRAAASRSSSDTEQKGGA